MTRLVVAAAVLSGPRWAASCESGPHEIVSPVAGVGAVGKSPAGATVESLAYAGDLSTAVVTAAVLGRVGLRAQL